MNNGINVGWNKCVNEWMQEWMDEGISGLVNECMHAWMDGWMDEWMNEWMNEAHTSVGSFHSVCPLHIGEGKKGAAKMMEIKEDHHQLVTQGITAVVESNYVHLLKYCT